MSNRSVAVFFDLYSTLVEESPSNPFYRHVADALGLPFERWLPAYKATVIDSVIGRLAGMPDRVAAACDAIGVFASQDAISRVVANEMSHFYESVRPYGDATQSLMALKQSGFRIGLISNASSYSEEVLTRSGLRDHFDSITLSYRLGCAKPDPSIYMHATNALGMDPKECVFVGDGGDRELEGARRLGFFTILLDRGLPHGAEASRHADRVESSLTAVVQRLLESDYGSWSRPRIPD